jgi:hypothetical protein
MNKLKIDKDFSVSIDDVVIQSATDVWYNASAGEVPQINIRTLSVSDQEFEGLAKIELHATELPRIPTKLIIEHLESLGYKVELQKPS